LAAKVRGEGGDLGGPPPVAAWRDAYRSREAGAVREFVGGCASQAEQRADFPDADQGSCLKRGGGRRHWFVGAAVHCLSPAATGPGVWAAALSVAFRSAWF